MWFLSRNDRSSGSRAGVPYSAMENVPPNSWCRREQLSPIQCSSAVCSLLFLPPQESSFSFCTFSYKPNCSFALSGPPTKAALANAQNVPLLLGFIPVPKGSHAEHQVLLSYFSSLPQAVFQLCFSLLSISLHELELSSFFYTLLFLCQPALTSFSLYMHMPPNASNLIYNCFFNFLLNHQLFHPAPTISAPQIQGRSSTAKLFPPRAPFPPHACKPHSLLDSWILTFSPLSPVKCINSHLCLCLCHVWVKPQCDHLLSVLHPELSALFHSFWVENNKFLTNFLIIKRFFLIFLKCKRKSLLKHVYLISAL